ncbi:MAG TPA: hypothetical protein VKU19_27320 [Bryobacteraceae bacterium]|nr:hypothetical protein [Bryobacteraceae bacterium]
MLQRILMVVVTGVCYLASTPAAMGASPKQVTWQQLPMVIGKTVSIAVAGGVVISGKATAVEPDALVVNVKSTTDGTLYAKGQTRVPRATLHTLELRTKGKKFRVIGTALGAGAGLVGGAVAAFEIGGILDNHNGGKAAAAFVGITAGATLAGYLVGNVADKRSTTIEIVP